MAKAKKLTLTEQLVQKQKKIDELQSRLDSLGARAYPITAVKKLLTKAKSRAAEIEAECREKVKLAINSFPKDSKELAAKLIEVEELTKAQLAKIKTVYTEKLQENYEKYSELYDSIKQADSHYSDAKLQLLISEANISARQADEILQTVLGPAASICDLDSKVDEDEWCDVDE